MVSSEAAMASGALWNTLVLVARLRTLWNLGWRCFPEVMGLLEGFAEVIGSFEENDMLQSAYRVMPERDFSSSLLQRAPDQLAAMPILGVLWSDWGKPERIEDALRRIGKRPSFLLDELPGGEVQPVQPSAVL